MGKRKNRKKSKILKSTESNLKINNFGFLLVLGIFLAVLLISFVSGQSYPTYQSSYSSQQPNIPYQSQTFMQPTVTYSQFYQPNVRTYYAREGIDYTTFWPVLTDPEKCEAGQDFIVEIRPGSCMPAVVRSDLLEEQNVPIFCKLDGVKLNPLIDVAEIRGVRFKGNYDTSKIAGISFHPSLAALRMYRARLDTPLVNDIGYVVVVLKRQPSEKEMPDFVEGNLTAVLTYDIRNAFGTGKPILILPQMSDQDWQEEYINYGFWKGKGYVRLDGIDRDTANLRVYTDQDHVLTEIRLLRGETSGLINMPGFYCRAGVKLRLDDISAPERKVRLEVDGNELWLRKGEYFGFSQDPTIVERDCYVYSIESLEEGGEVRLSCRGRQIMLRLGVSDVMSFEKDNLNVDRVIGDKLDSLEWHIVYSGLAPERISGLQERRFVVLVKDLGEDYLEHNKVVKKSYIEIFRAGIKDLILRINYFSSQINTKERFIDEVKNVANRNFKKDKVDIEVLFVGDEKVSYKFVETGGAFDKKYDPELETAFEKAMTTSRDLVALYGSEKKSPTESYGEVALFEAADLAGKLNKKATQKDLLNKMIQEYPESSYAASARAELMNLERYNYENTTGFFDDGIESHFFKILDIKDPGYEEASVNFLIDGVGEKRVKKGEEIISEKVEEYDIIKDYLDKIYSDGEGRLVVNLSNSVGDYGLKSGVLEWYSKTAWTSVESELDEWKTKLKNELIRYRENQGLGVDYRREILILKDFREDSALISHTYKDVNGVWRTDDRFLGVSEFGLFGRFSLRIKEINLKREAVVTVLPEIPYEFTEANFSFKVGIEKRAIQLSPEKTQELILKLNKTIENWQDIVDKLGNVVKTWKGVCFGTSALLFAKNFFENLGGKSMARQAVMRGQGGWNEKCQKMVAEGKYPTLDACFFGEKENIGSAVSEMERQIQKTNQEIQSVSQKHTQSEGIFGQHVDNKAAGKDYMESVFLNYYRENNNKEVKMPDGSTVKLSDVFANEDTIKTMYEQGRLSWQDMKDIVTYGRMYSPENANFEIAGNKLSSVLAPIRVERQEAETEATFAKVFGDGIQVISPTEKGLAPKRADIRTLTSGQAGYLGGGINEGAEVLALSVPAISAPVAAGFVSQNQNYNLIAGKRILTQLEKKDTGVYNPKTYYFIGEDGKIMRQLDQKESAAVTDYLGKAGVSYFEKWTPELCQNQYQKPEVRYFETTQYKGLPAIVPVDLRNGWYVATKPIISPVFGQTPYTEAGQLSSFWLCNVGQNGLEEFDSSVGNDQPCIQVNLNTGQALDQIPCLSEAEARNLVARGVAVIREASLQYGKKTVTLSGVGNVKVGRPGGTSEGTSCQDFMSPEDCHLLFNVCDPVLCPPSRCNLGGAYPVDDVVQTGVIGSIMLCLPNIREGIVVPVCLTGIHAGLDAYLSILKSFRDCLQESLDTGQTVGICDEIFSIYLCEFFWRQAAPLMDIAIPKLLEVGYGQGTRGGGEYLTVQDAWNNAQKSASYFTDYYGLNAFKAFKARTTGEIGSEVCKAFIGTKFPNNKKMLDALLEPESPVQFYAWFDEIPYSEATVPATSQYKVYYHIFAGNDIGHYYSVYLKSPPTSGFYISQPFIYVETGFVGKSNSIDRTRDFTAPAGYKELCVRIDTKEYCGFKQVSTDFALNYIKDAYLQEQLSQQVNSEKECVSGEPSLTPVLQPNIQEGVSEAVFPAVYNRGVIRVCSSDNPGSKTDPARWKNVGYCDRNKGIGCWLDVDSAKQAIRNREILDQTLQDVQGISDQIEGVVILTPEQTDAQLEVLRQRIIEMKDVRKFNEQEINDVVGQLEYVERAGFDNRNKAEALYLKFDLYRIWVEFLLSKFMGVTAGVVSTVVTAEQTEEVAVAETVEQTEEMAVA